MPPPMTFRMAQHLKARRPIALLARIEHPDGDGLFWSGVGKLRWNGMTFTGSGVLGSVTPIDNTSDIVIQDIQFQMAGVDQSAAGRLNDNVRNRRGQAWLAGIARGNLIVPDPYLIADAELDYQTLNAKDDGSVTVTIFAHGAFYQLERALNESWTSEDQRRRYPNDSGLDLIVGLQNQDIQWTPS